MPADPSAAGKKGGASRSAAKLAAARRNGFQKLTDEQRAELRSKMAAHVPAGLLDEVHTAAVAAIERGEKHTYPAQESRTVPPTFLEQRKGA